MFLISSIWFPISILLYIVLWVGVLLLFCLYAFLFLYLFLLEPLENEMLHLKGLSFNKFKSKYFHLAQVWDIVETYDTGCTPGGGKDGMGVFYDAGLLFESNTASGTPYRQGETSLISLLFCLILILFLPKFVLAEERAAKDGQKVGTRINRRQTHPKNTFLSSPCTSRNSQCDRLDEEL